jgi:hypothetical protein
MKLASNVFASIATLLAVGLAQAADPKPVNRVLSVTEIQTADTPAYVNLIAAVNAEAKTKLGVDSYTRVFVTNYDGDMSGTVYAVNVADSVATLTKGTAVLMEDPELQKTRDQLMSSRKAGARVLYQGVRFDGTYKNASVYTTTANVMDEPGYLTALDRLRALFNAHGFQDAHINAYRVIAGRTNHTHRVSIILENDDRMSAFLDFIATSPDMMDWLAGAAKLRTVVANATLRDITK